MKAMSEITQTGVIPLESTHQLEQGMSQDQIVALVGAPFRKLTPDQVKTPSEALAELGSSFTFGDQNLTEVWMYLHERRGKFKLKRPECTYLGFEGELMRRHWRDQPT